MNNIKNVLILLSILALFSCHKKDNIEENTETENVEKVDSVSAKEIQENQVKEILFAKKIEFEYIYISKDEFDNTSYQSSSFSLRDGKFDESKGIFTEKYHQANQKIPQKFVFTSGILTLDRVKLVNRDELQKDRTYNFEIYLRDYGILAIDKSVKATKGETYCGMLIYNTIDFEIYSSDSYVEAIKNDFKQLNNEK